MSNLDDISKSSTGQLELSDGSVAAGRKKRGTHVFPTCTEYIIEGSKCKRGHETIFCEWTCKSWLHHCCAGISLQAFAELREFLKCPHCQLKMYKMKLAAYNKLSTLKRFGSLFAE